MRIALYQMHIEWKDKAANTAKVEKQLKTADVIIVPANWPAKRSNHWKTLLQARAIENQVYIFPNGKMQRACMV